MSEGYAQEIADMKIAVDDLNDKLTPQSARLSTIAWLVEVVPTFEDNQLRCTYCDATDRPLMLSEGGTTPEYSCILCSAQAAIQWYEEAVTFNRKGK